MRKPLTHCELIARTGKLKPYDARQRGVVSRDGNCCSSNCLLISQKQNQGNEALWLRHRKLRRWWTRQVMLDRSINDLKERLEGDQKGADQSGSRKDQGNWDQDGRGRHRIDDGRERVAISRALFFPRRNSFRASKRTIPSGPRFVNWPATSFANYSHR